jgi:hypothetical protein
MKTFVLLCLWSVVGRSHAAFQRVGTFFICSQISPTCNTSTVTNAEIVTATEDGNTLLYTDGLSGKIGFVNIADPTNPTGLGTVDFAGTEPTSVVVRGGLALAAINTSPNFTNPSGFLAVINITSRVVVRSITLPGQPDCVTQSGNVVAIAMENERNETLNGGNIPQLPAGSVVLIDVTNPDPASWNIQNVDITNLPNVDFASDPEPEYISINSAGVVAVTLQENNAVVLLSTNGTILSSFNLGIANVSQVDTVEEKNLILQNGSISKRREPDGIAWIDNTYFATANEGDFSNGGTRGISIFDSRNGSVVYDSGNEIEWLVARIGNYNEVRLVLRRGLVSIPTFVSHVLIFFL